jgi:hypothetical protein
MNLPEPNDPMSRTLAEWRVQPKADPNFRPAVWQRIRERTRETWATYVQAHLAAWSIVAVVAVTAAGWTGVSVGRARQDAAREAMVVSYLVELDPRVQAKLRQ